MSQSRESIGVFFSSYSYFPHVCEINLPAPFLVKLYPSIEILKMHQRALLLLATQTEAKIENYYL